ncbi:hypothetical protein MKW92_031133 [Papaver armeniacum]|nr:hypothetical protein MKW92_031133 [Papaver armeniacum]
MDTSEENIESIIETLSILEKSYRVVPTLNDETEKLMLIGVLDDALMQLLQRSRILKRIGGRSIASTLAGKDVGSRRQKHKPPTQTVMPPPSMKSSLRRRQRTRTMRRHLWSLTSLFFFFFFLLVWLFGSPLRLSLFF